MAEKRSREDKGRMTVAEAGHKGGMRTAETHGHKFYEDIGHKGGQRVKELIEAGKGAQREAGRRSESGFTRGYSSRGENR